MIAVGGEIRVHVANVALLEDVRRPREARTRRTVLGSLGIPFFAKNFHTMPLPLRYALGRNVCIRNDGNQPVPWG